MVIIRYQAAMNEYRLGRPEECEAVAIKKQSSGMKQPMRFTWGGRKSARPSKEVRSAPPPLSPHALSKAAPTPGSVRACHMSADWPMLRGGGEWEGEGGVRRREGESGKGRGCECEAAEGRMASRGQSSVIKGNPTAMITCPK